MSDDRAKEAEERVGKTANHPGRLAVDAKGFVWRVYGTHWSMAPSNPDNFPVPYPVTFYEPVETLWNTPGDPVADVVADDCPVCGSDVWTCSCDEAPAP